MANHKKNKKTEPARVTRDEKRARLEALDDLEEIVPVAAEALAELATVADDVGGSRDETEDVLHRLVAELPDLETLLAKLQAAAEACDPEELRAECPELVGEMVALLDGTDALVGSARRAADGVFDGAFEGVELDEDEIVSDVHNAADCLGEAATDLRAAWDERFGV